MKSRRIFSAAHLSLPFATALVALFNFATPAAFAASQNWTGGGANANWGTALNWNGAAPGSTGVTTNTDVATFNAAIANTWGLTGSPILIDSATQNIGGISFTQAADNYFVGTTAGSSLRLTSAGTIQILSGLTATNAVETINAPLVIQGAAGTYTFANNSANGSGAGAGTLNFAGGITGGAAGATVLTLSGSNTNANTISSIIGNGTATTLSLTKSGAGTWVLGGANTYTGSTVLNGGTLRYTADNTGIRALNFGVLTSSGSGTNNVGSTTVSTIDASTTASSLTATSINVFTNSATANTINIGTGKTLTSTGGLTLGHDGSLAASLISETARLTVAGAGNFAITGGNVTIGASQTTVNAANDSIGVLDLTGLTGSFTTNVTTFSLGLGATAGGTLLLGNGATNTIQATTLTLGDSGGNNPGNASVLTMGTATNVGTYTLRADAINIGGGKGSGTIKFFNTTAGTGSVTITNKAGTGNATLLIGNNDTNTATSSVGTLDLRGHTAMVSAGVVTLGVTTNNGGATGRGIIQFNTGTFNATSLSIGSVTGATDTAGMTGTSVNVGGGTFTVSGATTMASHSGTAASSVTTVLNVTGGTFTTGSLAGAKSTGATAVATSATSNINVSGTGILNTGTYLGAVKTAANTGIDTANINVSGGQFNVTGATFQLASQATAGSAVGLLNITGGTVTSNANITVAGTNTSTITLNGGTLNMTGKNIGTLAAPVGTLNFQSGALSNLGTINGTGGLTKTTAGALTLSGLNTFTGDVTISASGGTLLIGSAGNGTSSALGSVVSTRTINVNTGGTLSATVAGGIFNNTFSTPATSLPALNIAGGILTNGGTATNSALGNITLSGGTLTATSGTGSPTGYGVWNLNGTVTSTGTSTISSASSFPITLSAATGTNTNFNVTGGTLTVSAGLGQITGADARVSSLTKSGAGTMILSGTNTYSGATLVSDGTLTLSGAGAVNTSSGITINGASAKLLQSSSVASTPTVTLTQGTLTGSGTVGNVDVGANTGGTISNNDGVAGASLTINTLTFSGGATVDTFSSGISAPIVTTSLVSNSFGVVTINPTAASWTNGLTYDLISYGSVGGAGPGQFALGPVIAGLTTRQSAIFGNSASAITLAISGDNPKWTGLDNGNWQIGTTGAGENWKLVTAGTATTFLATDDVLFDDTATLKTVDISNGNVSPSSVVFNNSSGNDYTVTGSNGIATGSLTKNNTGTVTLSNANTYAGGTTLNAGTLALGNTNAIGSGTLTITGGSLDSSVANLVNAGNNAQAWNGDFAFTGTQNLNLGTGAVTMSANRTVTVTANTLTVGGVIGGGAVSLTKAGAGTLILTGNNTYSGGTTINDNSGTLQATKNAAVTNAIGSGAVGIGAGSTLVLDITKTTNITDAIANTFTGAGLLKIQFAAGPTARNTTMPNVTGFSGTIQLSNLGSTGDKWNAASLGTVAGSLLVDSGSTIFVQTAPASFTGGITLNGAGSSEGRGAIRLNNSLGGNITLASSSAISMESTANALLTGNISSGAAGTQTLTLGGTGSTGGTLSGIIGGGTDTIALATAVGGTYTLTNANTYTGTTTIAASTTLQLGNGTTGNDGTIANSPSILNNGTLVYNRFGSISYGGAITGTGAVTKLGAGTQTLSGLSAIAANNYSGTTTINNGTLAFTTSSPSLTGGLTFGSANTNVTAGILDLTTANATFAGALLVNTNSATANEIKIGAAQALTINGNVQIGATTPVTGSATVTKLNLTGGGAFNVATAAAGTFVVGASTLVSTTTSQDSTLDLTELSSTSINTSATGTIRVNANTTSNSTGYKSTLLLPTPVVADTVATATLTAGTIGVGVGSTFNSIAGQINTLQLGTGLTTLNADTIGVGTGGRDIGQIIFGGAGGDVIIRAADGTSRATTFAVATGGATTATTEATTNNLVDFSSHDADILVASLNVGNQARVGNLISEFKFGAGTGSLASVLDATNVNIGFRTGTATATSVLTNRVAINGGTVTFGNVGATGTGVNIGSSTYSGAGAASTIGELNISGGTVTINNGTGGFAVRLGTNVASGGGTVTASLNLTGGTTTLGGDIIKGATSPRTTSTLSLNGASATLDMGGNDITSLDTITYTDGTLKNLGTVNTGMTLAGTGSRIFDQATGVNGEIQGAITGTGIGLTKQGDGKLTLSGTNNYTSATLVSAGTLFVTGSITSDVTVSDNSTLGGGGSVGAIAFGGNSFFDIALALAGNPLDSAAGTISFAATGFGIDNLVSNGAAVDWGMVSVGTYTLINGNLDETNLSDFGSANAVDLGGGRSVYFQEGSLQLVVVPEPSSALLGALGALLILRRRRS